MITVRGEYKVCMNPVHYAGNGKGKRRRVGPNLEHQAAGFFRLTRGIPL